MADALALKITATSDLAWIRAEAIAALTVGRSVNVFETREGAMALVFRAMPRGRNFAVLGPRRSASCVTPAEAIDAGLLMIGDGFETAPSSPLRTRVTLSDLVSQR